MLVETGQYMVCCGSHVRIKATKSHHGYSKGVAGHEFKAVNNTFCHGAKEGLDFVLMSFRQLHKIFSNALK